MKIRSLLFALIGLLYPMVCFSQGADGVESFKQDKNAWRRQETQAPKKGVTERVRKIVNATAIRNISEAEQAFCYTVESVSSGYTGYTMDGMGVTGFCGILSKAEIDLFVGQFLSKDGNVSSKVAKCIIKPRIMLRFMYGVDYTDVLFSSPCHSFTIFYAGKVRSFNASPSTQLLDTIVTAYEKKKMPFVSPALLGQVLPIGVPQNDEQKALVKSKSVQQPIRNWQQDTAPEQKAPVAPEKKGWNRLKTKS